MEIIAAEAGRLKSLDGSSAGKKKKEKKCSLNNI